MLIFSLYSFFSLSSVSLIFRFSLSSRLFKTACLLSWKLRPSLPINIRNDFAIKFDIQWQIYVITQKKLKLALNIYQCSIASSVHPFLFKSEISLRNCSYLFQIVGIVSWRLPSNISLLYHDQLQYYKDPVNTSFQT